MLVTKIKLNLVGTHTANIHDKKTSDIYQNKFKENAIPFVDFFGMQNFKGGNLIAK